MIDTYSTMNRQSLRLLSSQNQDYILQEREDIAEEEGDETLEMNDLRNSFAPKEWSEL